MNYLAQNCFMRKLLFSIFILLIFDYSFAQNSENWTAKQLAEPADLAASIKSKKDVPVIISVGPGTTIPNTIAIGMTNNKDNIEKLKQQLKLIPKDKKIVLYCGCCPFEHCPNVRPAIEVLKEMKFSNYYLLNLPHNIKKDWIDMGYPVSK
jgi:rhodanese-related sulfurtransferase